MVAPPTAVRGRDIDVTGPQIPTMLDIARASGARRIPRPAQHLMAQLAWPSSASLGRQAGDGLDG